MITPDIISYIISKRALKTPDAEITKDLLSQGWSEADITEAMKAISNNSEIPKKPVGTIVTPELKKYRNDRKWLLFIIGSLLLLFSLSMIFGDTNPFGGAGSLENLVFPIVLTIAELGVIYFAAKSVANSMKPKNGALEFFNVIGHIVLMFLVSVMIGSGVFFATCLIVFSVGNGF